MKLLIHTRHLTRDFHPSFVNTPLSFDHAQPWLNPPVADSHGLPSNQATSALDTQSEAIVQKAGGTCPTCPRCCRPRGPRCCDRFDI